MEFRAYLSQLADCDLSVYSRLEPAEVSVTRKRFWLDCDHNAQVRRPDFHYRRLRPLEVEQNLERLEQLRPDRLELTGVERELGTWIWEDVWTKNQALQALIRYQGAARLRSAAGGAIISGFGIISFTGRQTSRCFAAPYKNS